MGFTGAFPWRGGKSKLASKIIPYFPEHKYYVEPFFGSGAMFFAREKKTKFECVNDLNGEIANFFRVVREQSDEFCERLSLYPHSRDDFNYLKGLNGYNLSPLDRALRFYIIQQNSFSGTGSNYVIRRASLKHPVPSLDLYKKRIKNFCEKLSSAYIENVNFEIILNKFDKDYTFFYLDPPYYETAQYAVGAFPISGYEHIANFMKTQKGKTALSINNDLFIRDLFKDFYIVEFPIKYSCKKGEATPRTELLIMNYEKEVDAC